MLNDQVNNEELKKLLNQNKKIKKQKKCISKNEIFDSMLTQLNVSNEGLRRTEMENIISNYLFITEAIRKDIQEIDERLGDLRELENSTLRDEDYKHKKYRYFAEINRNAKDKIMEFYSGRLKDWLFENKSYKYFDRKDDSLTMLFFNGRYEYAQFRKYYSNNYDFSTEAKLRFIPGIFGKEDKVINTYIELKASSPENYNKEIERMVTENKIIEYIRDKIRYNHHLSRRDEIFETLTSLFNQNKYQTFIALSVLQLEGLFYDCCSIIAKKELGNRAGTLVEKAQKVFSAKPILQFSIYPYFAFDVPELRNEVAHNGMVNNKEPKIIANNIILDLYTLVYWANHLSNDKYIHLIMIMDKIKDIQDNEEEVIKALFLEMIMSYQISNGEFIDVLKDPNTYKDEIEFYEPQDKIEGNMSLGDTISFLSDKIRTEGFWKYMLDMIDIGKEHHESEKLFDLIDFVAKLKNTFIPVLQNKSPEKLACEEVAKRLKQVEDTEQLF